MPTGSPQYALWRQDDNGNTFLMRRFHSREQAERVRQGYQSHGHKQLYQVTVVPPQAPDGSR